MKKITIVTVCYNAQADIRETMESVISQTYPNLEYLVIDGRSTDGTTDIVREYQKKFPIILVSEKDKGIYDAMNKGIRLATGDYVNFMNAGDVFLSNDVLEKVAPYLTGENDLAYGATEFRYDGFSVVRKPRPLLDYWKKMPFNHQSLFAKTGALKEHPFDLTYPMAADYESVLFFMEARKTFKEMPFTVAAFNNRGISNQKTATAIAEYRAILDRYHQLTPWRNIYYNLLFAKVAGKKLLPRWVRRLIYAHFVK